jgi:hypothetical protein
VREVGSHVDERADSKLVLRHGNVKSTRPLAGSMHIRPPTGGFDSPPANTSTRRLPWSTAGMGDA